MEIKLITTNATTSGGGGGRVGFRFLGNVEIAKPKPTIFGTTIDPNQTVGFKFNNVETTVNSNNEGHFELYRDSDEPIKQFSTGTNNNLLKTLNVSGLDTSQVTDMSYMFYECESLTSLDVSNWNISQVTDIDIIFSYCISLRTIKINDEASANKLIAQIKTDLNKTATWDSETKIITISA